MQLLVFQPQPRWTPGFFFPSRKEILRIVRVMLHAHRGSFLRSCILFVAASFLLIAPLAFGDPDAEDAQGGHEYQTKAEFLFSFAKFIEWPQKKFTQPDSPLVIGIVGADPFGGLLEEAVQTGRVRDRMVTIRHVEAKEEMRKCHILFVSRSELSRLGSILSDVSTDNVLTVGESDKFISRGGIINFVMMGTRVRFEINNKEAKHAKLKISSMLSNLAVPPTTH